MGFQVHWKISAAMPNGSLEGVASKILIYTDEMYDQEYPNSHKYSIPTRLRQLEQRIAGFDDNDPLYDIDTESVHEYLIRLDDDDLFTASAFLGHILNPPINRLVIPDYQRDYSWKQPNLLRYWIDIKSLLHSINEGVDQKREKYMGSAYISDESDNLEIIDGQQRITTSLLLLLNIKKYLDLLVPHVENADDGDFASFLDHFVGPDHLEQMLYPSGGEPALEPNESDVNYFNVIFAKERLLLEQHLGDIETTEGPGGVIGDEKLLRKELGYAPHEIEDLSTVPDGQNFVQKQSNRLLREAFTFFREQVGDLISQQRILPENRDLTVNVLAVNSSSVTLQAGASVGSDDQLAKIPVGGAHVYYLPNEDDGNGVNMGAMSEETHQGTTDACGNIEIEFETVPDDGGTIVVTSGYQTETLSFSAISDLEPLDISIVSMSEDELIVAVFIADGGEEGASVEINGTRAETDENGVVVFDLTDIIPTDSEGEEAYQIRLSDGTTREIPTDGSPGSECWPIAYGDFGSPIDKAHILINLVFVLLHSIRIVYAEFGIPNKQYKIDIFQSLNDRGEDLDIRDIIRARVIAKEVDNVYDWKDIDDRFDGTPDDIDDFLKNYITAEQGLTKPDSEDVESLFELTEATVGNADSILVGEVNDAEDELSKLETYSKRYKEILDASLPPAGSGEVQGFTRSHASGSSNLSQEEQNLREECEAQFSYLNEVGTVWHPFVLSLYYNFSQTDGMGQEFNSILKTLVKIIYRYTPYGEGISSTVARTYLHDMAKILVNEQLTVHDSEEIIDKLQTKLPEELELEDVARRFATRRNWQSGTVKSLYARYIDIQLSQQGTEGQYITRQFERTSDDDLTIEHIFPSSLGLESSSASPKRWLEVYFDPISGDSLEGLINELEANGEDQSDDIETLRQKFVNDIGNMIPLIHAENASVSDRLFSKKIAYYFLVGMTEMKNTDEYLYDEHTLADIVPLIETFVDNAEYSDDVAASIFGLLVESGDSAQQETISNALTEYNLNADGIESTEFESDIDGTDTVKDKIRSMLSRDGMDETASSAPDIVKNYNQEWTVKVTKARKEDIIRKMLMTLAFEGEYDASDDDEENFGIDLQFEIEEDYEKRIDLR